MHQLDRLVAALPDDDSIATEAVQNGAAGLGQHGKQRVPPAGAVAWAGDLGEESDEIAVLKL